MFVDTVTFLVPALVLGDGGVPPAFKIAFPEWFPKVRVPVTCDRLLDGLTQPQLAQVHMKNAVVRPVAGQ